MALFHLTENDIQAVHAEKFSTLGITERGHLQRVLRNNLGVIAPDCLLITEEFGEWDEASRRIDLLAIDKRGNLVVIELKRTEDAGHAELQAIRYAAMVSTMTFDQAVEARRRYLARTGGMEEDSRERILSFLEWAQPREDEFAKDVRIILASANFSKELTSAVLWLQDRDVDITCVRLQPYQFQGNTLLDVQVIIPLPETAEYQVKVRQRDEIRREAANSERNQKYDVIAGDVTERGLYKRQALHRLVRALVQRGVTPEQLMEKVPSYNRFLFFSVDGNLRSEEFIEAAREDCDRQQRKFEPSRFSLRDDELIHFGDRTYAVTNQVGSNLEAVLTQLSEAFPLPDVRWQRTQSDGIS